MERGAGAVSSKVRLVSGAPCQPVHIVRRMRARERFLSLPPFRDLLFTIRCLHPPRPTPSSPKPPTFHRLNKKVRLEETAIRIRY